jgi:hypothetical protein
MTHKLTDEKSMTPCAISRKGHTGDIAGFSTWIDGNVCLDVLALRLNKIIVANCNHDEVVRAVTGEA